MNGGGFRLGQVNSVVPEQFCADELATLEEAPGETVGSDFLWSFEAGYKGTTEDGRYRLNVTAFYNAWNNFRAFRNFETCGFGFNANLGNARSIGLEVETQAKLTKTLKAGLGFGFLNAEVTEGEAGLLAEEGDELPFSTPFNANFNLEYNTSFSETTSFYARYDLQHAGERSSVFNPEERPDRVFDAYTLMNLRAGITFGKYEVSAYVQNLTNEVANFGDLVSLATETTGRPRYATNRPRIIGLQLKARF